MIGYIPTFDGIDLGDDVRLVPFSKNLTNAQFKALPTTPQTLLDAPGVNRGIVGLSGIGVFMLSGGGYTNIHAAAFLKLTLGDDVGYCYGYVPNDAGITDPSVGTDYFTRLCAAGNKTVKFVPWSFTEGLNAFGPIPVVEDLTSTANLPLTIGINNQGDGDLTGGVGGNVVKIRGIAVVVNLD